MVVGHKIWYMGIVFFGLQENSSETRVHGGKELGRLGDYGSTDCRNCITFKKLFPKLEVRSNR